MTESLAPGRPEGAAVSREDRDAWNGTTTAPHHRGHRPAAADGEAATPSGRSVPTAAPPPAAPAGGRRHWPVWSLVRLNLILVMRTLPRLLATGLAFAALYLVFRSMALLPEEVIEGAVMGFVVGGGGAMSLADVWYENADRLHAALPVTRADVVNASWLSTGLALVLVDLLYIPFLVASPDEALRKAAVLLVVQVLAVSLLVFARFAGMHGLRAWLLVALTTLCLLALIIGLSLLFTAHSTARPVAALLMTVGTVAVLWHLSHRAYRRQDL